MFTLVVSNRKGGTAKTTTAVNLAAEFSHQGLRCLLIDLDPQGHSGLGLGITTTDAKQDRPGLLADSRQALSRVVINTGINNLFFIPPGSGHGTNPQADRLQRFLQRKQLSTRFDVIVIDTPPNAGIEQSAALLAADGVLLPFMPTPLGRVGVQHLLDDLQALTATPRHKLSYALVPIMLDPRVKLDRAVLADMIRMHGSHRLLRGVRRNVRLAEAFDAGQPVNRFDARSRGAFDYHMLSQELGALWPALYPSQASLSFRPTAEVHSLPAQQNPSERNKRSHRGIRLKNHCRQWHG